jgi:hypothetical protein
MKMCFGAEAEVSYQEMRKQEGKAQNKIELVVLEYVIRGAGGYSSFFNNNECSISEVILIAM